MFQNFFFTFDLRNASQSDYDRVYDWAHRTGGYRYGRFSDGTWYRLPTTSIVVPLDAATSAVAREQFEAVLKRFGLDASHVAVTSGTVATTADAIPMSEVPDYAKPNVAPPQARAVAHPLISLLLPPMPKAPIPLAPLRVAPSFRFLRQARR